MSNKNDALGTRMKSYEYVTRKYLERKSPVILRLDGKAFHSFTRGLKKPFDDIFVKSMQDTMKYLCENIQGCVLGYCQSDEVTLVLVDYQSEEACAWPRTSYGGIAGMACYYDGCTYRMDPCGLCW